MRLLVWMDASRVGGPAKQLLAATGPLAARGVETEFVLALRRGRETPFSRAVRATGRPAHLLVDRFTGDPRLLPRFRRLLDETRPDILQTHTYRPDTLARLAARSRRRLGLPWVAFWHGATWENWKVRLYHRLDHWAMAGADRVVTVSETQGAGLRSRLPADVPVGVVPNAVLLDDPPSSPAEREALRAELLGLQGRLLVGVFGRFSREKGQDVFLDALATVATRAPGVVAVLLGEGPDEAELRQRAGRLGLDAAVRFLGYRDDVARYYDALDLLVLPSRSEGSPNVVLEAARRGVAVVATAVGGVPEVLTDGETGWLVASEDPGPLAAAMTAALTAEDERARRAAAGRMRVEESFSLDARVDRLAAIYRELDDRPQ